VGIVRQEREPDQGNGRTMAIGGGVGGKDVGITEGGGKVRVRS